MTTMINGLHELLSVLDALLDGDDSELSVLDALANRSDLPKDVAAAVHQLLHYVADEDIRQREPEYAEHWRTKLEAMRERLQPVNPPPP
jgi:hypothetical protein